MYTPNLGFTGFVLFVYEACDPFGSCDLATVTITINSIRQDEPTNGTGDGDTSPDGFGIGASRATIRAERAGTGNGRVYHITYTAVDSRGGTCTKVLFVGVRHNMGKKGEAIDDGPLYDSTQS